MKIAVHITHESVKKIGGIGSVLSGVCNLQSYKDFYEKTVFYGPIFDMPTETIGHLGKSGELLYSSHDQYDRFNYRELLGEIVSKYNIEVVYGKRKLVSEFDITKHNVVEVINIGIHKINHNEVEKFKYALWKNFGIKSHLYENNWDYEQYLRIGIAFLEILEKLYGRDAEYYHFSHEYMGVPSVLSVLMSARKHKTVFVAHEVTTARSLVEAMPGHDISFYNILKKAKERKSLETVFGSQEHNYRSELIKRATNCDHIFAVGDKAKEEYLFLVPETPPDKIKVVYNGVTAKEVSFEQKLRSRRNIERYIDTLFNFTPDVIFTHVTRLVISKGIWRDVDLLYFLDEIFDANDLKGIYILLSTLIATGRPPEDIFRIEGEYGWPVLHREGWPDLIGAEKEIYDSLQVFNSRSKSIKGVFINQFGFERTSCGKRVPENMEFEDLRIASDAEFGFSIYEPFGISQIETIPFGGVSVLSSSCGAAAFLQKKFKDAQIKPYYILDYIAAGKKLSYNALKNLTKQKYREMERQILAKHAKNIFEILALTNSKREEYLLNAQKYRDKISWDSSSQDYVFC